MKLENSIGFSFSILGAFLCLIGVCILFSFESLNSLGVIILELLFLLIFLFGYWSRLFIEESEKDEKRESNQTN